MLVQGSITSKSSVICVSELSVRRQQRNAYPPVATEQERAADSDFGFPSACKDIFNLEHSLRAKSKKESRHLPTDQNSHTYTHTRACICICYLSLRTQTLLPKHTHTQNIRSMLVAETYDGTSPKLVGEYKEYSGHRGSMNVSCICRHTRALKHQLDEMQDSGQSRNSDLEITPEVSQVCRCLNHH